MSVVNPASGITVPGQQFVAGLPYGPDGPISVTSIGNGNMSLVPYRIESAHTWAGMSCHVTVAGSAGASYRLGIYADAGGQPGALVADLGTVVATATGIVTATGAFTTPPGWYWLAQVLQGTPSSAPTAVGFASGLAAGSPLSSTNYTQGCGWHVNGITGALPTPLTGAQQTTLAFAPVLIA